MPTFTPPTVNTVPRYLPDSTPQQKGLYKFYKPYAAFVQVFLLSDGTFVQNYATPENSNTNIPYPWNPNDPSAPYSWAYYVDYSRVPARQAVESTKHAVWIVKMWDRPSTVTAAEATALQQAGYSAYIS
jgi:hypothetical protein